MSITVEFRSFEDMVGFAEQLLGQVGDKNPPAAQPEQPTTPVTVPVTPPAPVSQPAVPVTPPVPTSQSVAPVAPSVPVGQPAASTPQAPPVVPVAQAVPTSTKEYTVDDLAQAAIPLMDAGGQQVLVNLLSQFGVGALPQLPKEQYGAFATALRGLGAKI